MKRIETYQSSSGITLYNANIIPDHIRLPIILSLNIRCGSLQDSEKRLGTAHFVEHMNMGFRQSGLAELTCLNQSHAITNYFETIYYFTCWEDELPKVCEILHKIIDGSYIVEEQVEKIRSNILEEYWGTIRSSKYKSNKLIYQNSMYEVHFPIGNLEGNKSIGIEDVRAFHQKWYRPQNLSIQSVGVRNINYFRELVEQIGGTAQEGKSIAVEEPILSFTPLSSKENIFDIEDDQSSYARVVFKTEYKQISQYLEDGNGIRTKCMFDVFSDIMSFVLFDYLDKEENEIVCTSCDFSKEIVLTSITTQLEGEEDWEKVLRSYDQISELTAEWITANCEPLRHQYQVLLSKATGITNARRVLTMMNAHDMFGRPLYSENQERRAMEHLIDKMSVKTLSEFSSYFFEISERKIVIARR